MSEGEATHKVDILVIPHTDDDDDAFPPYIETNVWVEAKIDGEFVELYHEQDTVEIGDEDPEGEARYIADTLEGESYDWVVDYGDVEAVGVQGVPTDDGGAS